MHPKFKNIQLYLCKTKLSIKESWSKEYTFKGIIQFGSNLETDNNEETELRGLLQIISHEVCTILASSNADRAKIACHKAIMLFNAFPSS